MTSQLREPWIGRTTRALDLLASRLDNPPSLHELALAAGYSTYHFHRVWRALLGETVGQTIARLRIAAAQQRLRVPGANVTNVAMDGGFATPQSFARAFRRVAGLSPSEFAASDLLESGVAAEHSACVQVELRSSCTLVALRRKGGSYHKLNALFAQLLAWLEDTNRLADLQGLYGMPLDDPLSVDVDQLRYDACFALNGEVDPPNQFHRLTLPAGEYVKVRHHGSYDDLETDDQALIRWVMASDHKPAHLPLIHRFLDDPDETPEEHLRADILLLLEPREVTK